MKDIIFNNTHILVGQNSSENWQIIDDSSQTYYWFHLKSFPSCHVIVQSDDLSQDLILYAAQLCKINTKYKNLTNVKVNYTPISNISKGIDIGSVHFKSNRKVKNITI
jgi:predicted ribosome quality control (RQC) complex YloA/Tae2 family protein